MAVRWHPWPVDLSDDLPSPRRPLLLPVAIATILLSVIAMSAGLVLGSRHRDSQRASVPVVASPTAVSPGPAAPPCRPETQTISRRFGASGTLRIVLLLRTKSTAVWICEDDAGRLYYHANRGGENAPWVEGTTALFMADVRRVGTAYEVVATDGTRFSVDSRHLFIAHKDGTYETQRATG
jgi:hypothetical protein